MIRCDTNKKRTWQKESPQPMYDTMKKKNFLHPLFQVVRNLQQTEDPYTSEKFFALAIIDTQKIIY